ncbi:MAG: hypothetical protein P8I29_02890, partial [Flavobacteriales bacterium]|nr:hypothetical protein [Flavobacteriales bacterium]
MIASLSNLRTSRKLLFFNSILFAFLLLSSSVYSQSNFSPASDISLSNLVQGSLSDISFVITQDADESDIASSIIVSNGGSFDISSL